MTIAGTCGEQIVGARDDLLRLLRDCRDGDFGEFWCGESGGPTLAIHTNRESAYLYFFPADPADRQAGFQSLGDREARGEVVFTQKGHGDFMMSRHFVVGLDRAYAAAAEFFERGALPSCIEWMEL